MAKEVCVKGSECVGDVLEPTLKQNVRSPSCQKNRGWGDLSLYPNQYHKVHGEKILTLFEQLESGGSIIHLICLGALLRAIKPQHQGMTGLQGALVLVDSNHSLISPVEKRRLREGKGLAEMSQLVKGRARTGCLVS